MADTFELQYTVQLLTDTCAPIMADTFALQHTGQLLTDKCAQIMANTFQLQRSAQLLMHKLAQLMANIHVLQHALQLALHKFAKLRANVNEFRLTGHQAHLCECPTLEVEHDGARSQPASEQLNAQDSQLDKWQLDTVMSELHSCHFTTISSMSSSITSSHGMFADMSSAVQRISTTMLDLGTNRNRNRNRNSSTIMDNQAVAAPDPDEAGNLSFVVNAPRELQLEYVSMGFVANELRELQHELIGLCFVENELRELCADPVGRGMPRHCAGARGFRRPTRRGSGDCWTKRATRSPSTELRHCTGARGVGRPGGGHRHQTYLRAGLLRAAGSGARAGTRGGIIKGMDGSSELPGSIGASNEQNY